MSNSVIKMSLASNKRVSLMCVYFLKFNILRSIMVVDDAVKIRRSVTTAGIISA